MVVVEAMPGQLLEGLRVLVASDHRNLASMFAAMVGVCGGVAWVARSASDAVSALGERPHVVLLDTALPDDLLTVPASAASVDVPIVAFAFRHEDSRRLPTVLRAFHIRLLRSTDVYVVCAALRHAVRSFAVGEVQD
jgi:CheY-like chemotaxis protein